MAIDKKPIDQLLTDCKPPRGSSGRTAARQLIKAVLGSSPQVRWSRRPLDAPANRTPLAVEIEGPFTQNPKSRKSLLMGIIVKGRENVRSIS